MLYELRHHKKLVQFTAYISIILCERALPNLALLFITNHTLLAAILQILVNELPLGFPSSIDMHLVSIGQMIL